MCLEVLNCAEADLQGCLEYITGMVDIPPDADGIRLTLDELAEVIKELEKQNTDTAV